MTEPVANSAANAAPVPVPVVPVISITSLQWIYTQLKADIVNVQSYINSYTNTITGQQAQIASTQAVITTYQTSLTNLNTCLTAVAANITAQGGKLP